ncbi:hypothetical protein ACQB6R_03395 [Propionibacteriaceae bacterium G1746]|uniref:hypothetical protein n=1 Tax=Aestuariimicrobium sp. G57 TaxID=3418485 RepID=UPI003C230BFD
MPSTPQLHAWTRPQLLAADLTDAQIRRAVARGDLLRLGPRWYGTTATPPAVAAALKSNHRLTCLSALSLHGVFTPRVAERHEVGRQCRCQPRRGVVEHLPLRAWPDDHPILSLHDSLADALRCLNAESSAVVLESALHRRLLHPDDLPALLDPLSQRQRRAIGRLDARAMSGSETRVRRFFERRGVKVRPQFPLPGGGYADLLVGERLLIECDSLAHHTDLAAFAGDRHRDQRNLLAGLLTLRLTYDDVWVAWEATKRLFGEILRTHLHRAPGLW